MSKEGKIANLINAIGETERFLDRAVTALDAFKSNNEEVHHSPSFAAVKQSSMDLTRALAELRKT